MNKVVKYNADSSIKDHIPDKKGELITLKNNTETQYQLHNCKKLFTKTWKEKKKNNINISFNEL